MKVEKTVDGSLYTYHLYHKDKVLAHIKGRLLNTEIILSLHEFNMVDPPQEKMSALEIGKYFFEDCRKNKSTIIVTIKPSTQKAVWFLQENNFNHVVTQYVFENNLEKLETPLHTFELKSLNKVDLTEYQKIYFECAKGDPKENLDGLTYQSYYDKDKKETGDLWDENLMHLVFWEGNPIGVLNLRTEFHQKNQIQEGSINYIGLLEAFRNRGLGKALHLTGLKKLKELGCKNYFGGTDSTNQAMLKTFKSNKCINTLTQHYYKAD